MASPSLRLSSNLWEEEKSVIDEDRVVKSSDSQIGNPEVENHSVLK